MIGLPDPTPIQYDIANTMQKPPSDRIIIEGFRGVAKSFIACAYAVWTLWRDPQIKVEVISASKDRSDANAVFIKRIIQVLPFLEELLPRRGQRDTQNLFDVGLATPDISPSVKSVGITGQITGTRADLLIADDVEVPNNSGTQMQRDKLSESVKEFDAILKPGGQIIYLGTPQNEMSLYNELQKRGYDVIIYPVVYPETSKEREEYGDNLADCIAQLYDSNPEAYAGYPTDPARFNEEEIAKRRLSYGKAGFALQFKLNTNLSDAEKYPLKVSDFIVADLDLEEASLQWSWASGGSQRLSDVPCVALKGDYFYSPLLRSQEVSKYTGTVMAIDPSGRGKDETAYAIVKFLNGYLFLMEVGGYRDGYTDATLKALANKAKFYGVNEIVVEANFGDGMFVQLIKPILNAIHPCSVEEVKNSKQKELRIIDTLEPIMMRHKLIVNTSVIREDYRVYEKNPAYSLIYQLTRISRDRGALAHDDRLDAVTMAVAHWLEVLDRDAQVGMEELLEEELEKWLDPDRGIGYIEEAPLVNKKRSNSQDFNNLNLLDGFFRS
jgi:DNA packaging protein B|uniref:Terminase n=1 Tax=virus sp. ctqq75 TaxID=2827999 RepID=A0A8S5REP0_9VIRU|nr:MAG TPA: Terminase [virus sp. ctqq75]